MQHGHGWSMILNAPSSSTKSALSSSRVLRWAFSSTRSSDSAKLAVTRGAVREQQPTTTNSTIGATTTTESCQTPARHRALEAILVYGGLRRGRARHGPGGQHFIGLRTGSCFSGHLPDRCQRRRRTVADRLPPPADESTPPAPTQTLASLQDVR
jgi:hypothetical protein